MIFGGVGTLLVVLGSTFVFSANRETGTAPRIEGGRNCAGDRAGDRGSIQRLIAGAWDASTEGVREARRWKYSLASPGLRSKITLGADAPTMNDNDETTRADDKKPRASFRSDTAGEPVLLPTGLFGGEKFVLVRAKLQFIGYCGSRYLLGLAMRPEIDFAGRAIQGQREDQEDFYAFEQLKGGRVLLVVADGAGGQASGELASRNAALGFLDDYFARSTDTTVPDAVCGVAGRKSSTRRFHGWRPFQTGDHGDDPACAGDRRIGR